MHRNQCYYMPPDSHSPGQALVLATGEAGCLVEFDLVKLEIRFCLSSVLFSETIVLSSVTVMNFPEVARSFSKQVVKE